MLGVATAAGFAALETMGYGFVSLLTSRGNLGILDEVLLVRGLRARLPGTCRGPAWCAPSSGERG